MTSMHFLPSIGQMLLASPGGEPQGSPQGQSARQPQWLFKPRIHSPRLHFHPAPHGTAPLISNQRAAVIENRRRTLLDSAVLRPASGRRAAVALQL